LIYSSNKEEERKNRGNNFDVQKVTRSAKSDLARLNSFRRIFWINFEVTDILIL